MAGKRLVDAMEEAMQGKAPKTFHGAQSRFGWTTKEIAARFGVTMRTAQRWQKAGAVPAARREQFTREVRREAAQRAQKRAAAKGFRNFAVSGSYRVSNYPAQYARGNSFRAPEGIPAAEAREVMRLLSEGRRDEAESVLSSSLGQHYGISAPVTWENVEGIDLSPR